MVYGYTEGKEGDSPMPLPITSVFTDLPDPRRETENKRHLLGDILTLAVCAVIGGAETWDAIAEYGVTKETFFRRFLSLPNGIPSPDTFSRVFAKLDPVAFAQRFGRWMASACSATGLVPVAVDGKSSRAAKKATATGCLHTVSAWATQGRLTLGQLAVEEGSNEVAAIPDLLGTLDLAGAIVTIDAAGCQKDNAKVIRGGGGHYLLCAKANQPSLLQAVDAAFRQAEAAGYEGLSFDHHAESDEGHGRREQRSVAVIYDPVGLPDDWPDVRSVVSVVRQREAGGVSTTTSHYYISSHAGTALEMAGLIRGHWGIENGLHWVLDVVFHEDQSRIKEGHAGENLSLLRRVAVALLKRAPGKGTTPTKRLKAGWDDEFLLQVLQGIPAIEVR
jgi:predicted transposase YbfD/YdcC